MSTLKVTRTALKASQNLPEGWYKAQLKKVERTASSKNNKVYNIVPTLVLFQEDESGTIERETKLWFYEPKLGAEYLNFVTALTGNTYDSSGDSGDQEVPDAAGVKEYVDTYLWALVKPDTYKGKITWRVVSFMHIDEDPFSTPFDDSVDIA